MIDINFTPDQKELRTFGLTMLIGFLFIAAFVRFVFGHETIAVVCLGLALALSLSSLTPMGIWVYRAWMGFAFVMGNIVSRVLLAGIYLLVVTPTGLLMRVRGRDPLSRGKTDAETYWVDLPGRADIDYERQF